MTPPSDKSHDGSFSAFTVGVLFGVAAALLFGTEEGRNLVKKAVNSIPDKYKPQPFAGTISTTIPVITPEETPHSTYYEAPPRPAPTIRPSRPEPFRPQS